MTPAQFDALFDTITSSAFRFEGLPLYAVDDEDADLQAWRAGAPVAERSVRTDPWLARIADQTINRGVRWSRVRHVTSPPSWYVAWEIADGYLESQAVGEEIRLSEDRSAWDGPDFWLFDAGTDRARGVLLHYDGRGSPSGFEPVTEAARLAELQEAAQALAAAASPLNRWIAEHRDELDAVGART